MTAAVIIDDDPDDIELLSEAIKEVAPTLALTSFTDPQEAIHFLNMPENCPSCVFLDINMPGLNGHECLEILRAKPFLKKCAVVILSTGMSADVKTVVKKKGATLAFKKPHSFRSLQRIVSKVMSVVEGRDASGR